MLYQVTTKWLQISSFRPTTTDLEMAETGHHRFSLNGATFLVDCARKGGIKLGYIWFDVSSLSISAMYFSCSILQQDKWLLVGLGNYTVDEYWGITCHTWSKLNLKHSVCVYQGRTYMWACRLATRSFWVRHTLYHLSATYARDMSTANIFHEAHRHLFIYPFLYRRRRWGRILDVLLSDWSGLDLTKQIFETFSGHFWNKSAKNVTTYAR